MCLDLIEAYFPTLKNDGYVKSSEATENNNCFAHAIHLETRRIDPSGKIGDEWPDDIIPTGLLSCMIERYRREGYKLCEEDDDGSFEEGYEKIVIYADETTQKVKHAARLLPSGKWISKIGDLADITHDKLESLEGYYGKITKFMKKPLPK
jgi:hypothetical protein